jgi:5'-3' exonuclease
VLCTDSKPYRRSVDYPEYKLLRADSRDPVLAANANTTLTQIRELVKVTGWPIWSEPGFESDDLVAHAVFHYRHRYKKIIAMSNDSDLYQLFQWPNFLLYKGKKGLYTREDYNREWGLPANKLVLALAMIGTHNEIEGIKGIGPATAKKLLLEEPSKYRLVRQQHLEIIERNEALIRLPHPEFNFNSQLPQYSCDYDERALVRFCAKYAINLQRWQSEAFERVQNEK